jgi:predicted metal-dependent phosphoesterase TrpH
MNTKKLLPLALLPIGIIPLITISCSSNETTTYFEAEGLKISSQGMVMGYANEGTHPEKLEIKEEYQGVKITEIEYSAFKNQSRIHWS